MAVVSMKQLLEAGVHFGHQTRRWNQMCIRDRKRNAANTTPLINSISSTLGLIRVFNAEIQIINKMNSCKACLLYTSRCV